MALVIPAAFAGDFVNKRNPARQGLIPHVIQGLIPEGKQSLLHARFGTYKTMLALHMALSIVLGKRDWMGLAINKAGVCVFIDSEDQADENERRIVMLASGLGFEGWPDGLIYKSIGVGDLSKADVIERIASFQRSLGEPVVMTFIDSYLQASGLDHFGASVDSKINAFYGRLRKLGTCLVLDHETDPASGVAPVNARPAGSSVKRIPTRSVSGLRVVEDAGKPVVELRQYKGLYKPFALFKFEVDFSDDLRLEMHLVGAAAKTKPEHPIVAAIRARGGEGMSNGEIMAATGIPRATFFRNVEKLKQEGILVTGSGPTGKILMIIERSNLGVGVPESRPIPMCGGGTSGTLGLSSNPGNKEEANVALTEQAKLNIEHLRFTQIGEVVNAFMDRLPVGDVALAMARWDTRRIAEGHAAYLARDAARLKRLNDASEQGLNEATRAWFEPTGRRATEGDRGVN